MPMDSRFRVNDPCQGLPVQGLRSLTVVDRDGTLAAGGASANAGRTAPQHRTLNFIAGQSAIISGMARA